MNPTLEAKLSALNGDYFSVTNRSVSTFFCPLLMRDESVPICRAHIINDAFSGSPKSWTVQRKDIDSFYGAHFEADFLSIQYSSRFAPHECLVDRRASVNLRPEIRARGERVLHYAANGPIPPQHAGLVIETEIGPVQLALKMTVGEVEAYAAADWEVVVEKDVRLSALVSLMKSAYLTLFELLGYRYALSSSGLFIGRTILGSFFVSNQHRGRAEIRETASEYFLEFRNLVRPVVRNASFDSTIIDRRLLVCETSVGLPWAFIVFVRTGRLVNAVLLPILEHPDAAARFFSFLKSSESKLHTRFCIAEEACFSKHPVTLTVTWPEANLT